MNLTRKEFLTRGVFSLGRLLLQPDAPAPAGERGGETLRPPGFREELAAGCAGCRACRDACSEGIIVDAAGGRGPAVDFDRGSCTFCSLCAGACPRGILTLPDEGEQARIGVARTVRNRCLAAGGCFSCTERCPEGALALCPGAGVAVDPERCTGCGACEHACPVEPKAIHVVPMHS